MKTRRTALVALAGMLSTAALARWARPTIHVSDLHPGFSLEDAFPKAFGEWMEDTQRAVVVPPPDQLAMLNKIYNQTLTRFYVNRRGVRITLSVAYGGDQSDGLTVHVPDVCYAAQGWKVERGRDSQLEVAPGFVIPVRHLVATLGGQVEPVTYWVLMGDEVTISNTQRRLVTLRYGLKRQIPEGMLVRVSSVNPDMDEAIANHAGFIQSLIRAVPTALRERVIGLPLHP
ncbi:exosortase-associated protein EpsI, B-type [Roseateles saccharophilus]|uniref:EpsI family protein n=1 Tax=Roseateles saccharophilus TaxID=304 RepID=A0A4R3UQY3_ROSSA|nr:exosortase-associated protein EpsI, B-type [Roseateles saccharophilus]MDG0833435.1 EpsI family protein [Roseateles saccharophilus]TCU93090.1 EpsI family protein [Roseateles saccharophilus]